MTPNVTWPDVVYYNSYSTPYMGWKIHIVDNFRQKPRRSGFGAASHSLPSAASLLITKTSEYTTLEMIMA